MSLFILTVLLFLEGPSTSHHQRKGLYKQDVKVVCGKCAAETQEHSLDKVDMEDRENSIP